MKALAACTIGSILVLITAGAVADTKIVELHHADGYTVGEKLRPPSDEDYVTWIGDERLREDRGSTSFVVLEREKRLLIIYHVEEQYTEVAIPFDIRQHLPPAAADFFVTNFWFESTLRATGERRTVGDWVCSGYHFEGKSKYTEFTTTIWATTEAGIDFDAANRMKAEILFLVFRGDYAGEMRLIPGLVIASEGSSLIPAAGVGPIVVTTTTKSIDEVEPPAGLYGPPPGYVHVDFDYQNFLAHWN